VKTDNILIRGKTTGKLLRLLGGQNVTLLVELGLDDGFARLERDCWRLEQIP
jgi:hypothetical protein